MALDINQEDRCIHNLVWFYHIDIEFQSLLPIVGPFSIFMVLIHVDCFHKYSLSYPISDTLFYYQLLISSKRYDH